MSKVSQHRDEILNWYGSLRKRLQGVKFTVVVKAYCYAYIHIDITPWKFNIIVVLFQIKFLFKRFGFL